MQANDLAPPSGLESLHKVYLTQVDRIASGFDLAAKQVRASGFSDALRQTFENIDRWINDANRTATNMRLECVFS